MTWTFLADLLARVGAAALNRALARGADVRLAREERGRPVHVHLSGGRIVIIDRRGAASSRGASTTAHE